MEPWVEKVLGSITNKELVVVETSKNIELLRAATIMMKKMRRKNPTVMMTLHTTLMCG